MGGWGLPRYLGVGVASHQSEDGHSEGLRLQHRRRVVDRRELRLVEVTQDLDLSEDARRVWRAAPVLHHDAQL